ncbi:MAG: sporadic carbohydrate cluster 2OG-Fe(II) oxygenase [Acidobacteriota bacterium]
MTAPSERFAGVVDDVHGERLAAALLERGWARQTAEARDDLEAIRALVVELAASHLAIDPPASSRHGEFLDGLGERIAVDALNDLRLAVFRGLAARTWLRPAVFRLARRALEVLVGNELAMQRRVNLSIQMPGDDSSLLPLHADSWSGDSPYEIVLWMPLVDCARTKSLFILPRPAQERLLPAGEPGILAAARTVDELFERVEDHVQFVDVPFGDVLLFDQNLLHGNRVNREATTRWSLNCRFKGLFTPYADKKLGEFFEPITVRPMSRLGMAHRFPKVPETPPREPTP